MPGGRYDRSSKAKAARLVREHAGVSDAVSDDQGGRGPVGMSRETLRKWIRQAEVDEGKAPGLSTAESAEMRELRGRP